MALKSQLLVRSTRVPSTERCRDFSDLEIRNLAADDAERLGMLLFAAFRNTIHGDVWSSERAAISDARRVLVTEHAFVYWSASYIALSEDTTAGATVVCDSKGGPLLFYCCTHPDFEGRGLARSLITRSLRGLHEIGMIDMYLNVAELNFRAYSLYRKLGFTHAEKPVFGNLD